MRTAVSLSFPAPFKPIHREISLVIAKSCLNPYKLCGVRLFCIFSDKQRETFSRCPKILEIYTPISSYVLPQLTIDVINWNSVPYNVI